MGEPRFPPPGGQSGYRDAGAPVSDRPRPPELDESSNPPVPRGKRVVAKRPDDPDVALAKAFYPGKPRVAKASSAGAVLGVIIVALYVMLQIIGSRPLHGRSRPPANPAAAKP